MIFSELYSAYYNTVAKILSTLVESNADKNQVRQIISDHAFDQSALAIMPAIEQERWQIIRPDMTTAIRHIPTMPLTLLQKQWLKAILEDPRVRLFDVHIEGLEDTVPLFTQEDYLVYDQYADGDPYEDPAYIQHFRTILDAIKTGRSVKVLMCSHRRNYIKIRCYPKRLEYSEKDDKFRVIAEGCKYEHFNVARVISCEYCNKDPQWEKETKHDELREITLLIRNERNALERVMMHFAHFEKRAERMNDGTHQVSIKYYASDETEMVIRVLSFGPLVKVLEPESFIDLIKDRLIRQKTCELR